GRAALPPEVPRHVGPALPSLDLDTRPIRLNGVRHGRYPNPWLWSHRWTAAAAPAPSDPTWSSSSESVVELSSAETASMTRARSLIVRSPWSLAVRWVTTMAFPSCAGAGWSATSPRRANVEDTAAYVAPTSELARVAPSVRNSSAEPAYSGTRSTRPRDSAGSTSSLAPALATTDTGYPLARNACPYSSASNLLSGKSNEATVIVGRAT